MTPTTIPSVFPVPSSITKSEPTPEARGPAIFCLTNSRTVSGTRNFFACREALAGCRGEALTRRGMSERACAVRHSHILSRKFPPFLGFLSVADRTTNETKCSLYECALREIPRLPVCRSRGTAVARKRQNDLLSGCQNCALTWRAARRKKLPTLRQCSGDTNPQKSGQDVGMSDRARSLRHSPPGQGFAPTPR